MMDFIETVRRVHKGSFGYVDSKELIKLAQDHTPVGRYALANAVSGFFEHDELNAMEHRLVIEIMMSLIHRAELDLREAMAERLSLLPNVPPEVIIFLANDEITVARPVLEHSPVLNDVDLIYIISSKGADYWQSIAKRQKLHQNVVGKLVDTEDGNTALNLVDNPHVILQKNTVKRLIKMSLKAEDLQTSLLRRPELDENLAIELYACVSTVLRREIVKKFRIPSPVVETTLENLIAELTTEAKGELVITSEMITLAERFKERGEISPVLLIRTLRRAQTGFFIALFAQKLGLGTGTILKIINKEGGKFFAVACRSAGMMKSEFASLYLLTQGIRTADKLVNQKELADVLKYYDTVKDFDVQRIRREWEKHPEEI